MIVRLALELSYLGMRRIYVIAPMKGSPADLAGVKSGDIIDAMTTKRRATSQRCEQLLNWSGGEVKRRVLRANSSPLSAVAVKRGTSPLLLRKREWTPAASAFFTSTASRMASQVKFVLVFRICSNRVCRRSSSTFAAPRARSLQEAVTVANMFVKDNVLAQTVGRENKALKTF